MAQLEQAISFHEQWHKNLLRVLVARLPPDPADLLPDAHLRCRFGRWYEGEAGEFLRSHVAFERLGEAHEEMHRRATGLLERAAGGQAVPPRDLDEFNASLDRMRAHIQTLRGDLNGSLQNLDPLTGARNRTTLISDLREQHALVCRAISDCTLAMIDLDHFKAVNDRYGHATGDAVLSAAVSCIHAHLRPYDLLYRYGGEEFLLCMPHTNLMHAGEVAERLRAAVAAEQFRADATGATFTVTASFGLAALSEEHSVLESLDRADRAMYEAKRAGRDAVRMMV
jgi:diguanylate cyclase